jgi:3-dehydroquinate synthase
MQYLIHRCAEMHLQHIAGGDPFEMGSSRPLDFGHWSAHKLEQLTDFELRHGEAVAIGIALDTVYSSQLGWLTETDAHRVLTTLRTLGFSLYHPLLGADNSEKVLRGLTEFREHLGGQLTIMLLQGIGHGVEVHEMDAEGVRQAIATLRNEDSQPIPRSVPEGTLPTHDLTLL